jgi:hypothetical protein
VIEEIDHQELLERFKDAMNIVLERNPQILEALELADQGICYRCMAGPMSYKKLQKHLETCGEDSPHTS